MYEINEYGDIINIKRNSRISERIHRGYRTVQLMSNSGKSKEYRLHRLVAYMFVDGYNETLVVNHRDGNKLNCHFSNLEWVTQKYNVEHANTNGLTKHAKGEKVNTSILNEKNVRFICALIYHLKGNIQYVYLISRLFIPEVNYSMIQHIRNGETWSDIAIEYFDLDEYKNHHYSTSDIEIICELINKNNGNIDKVSSDSKLYFEHPVPNSFIRSLIGKRCHVSISDKYFDKNKYRQRLTNIDVHDICRTLINNDMDVDKCFSILNTNNPRITKERIRDVKLRESHTDISSLYF